MAITGRRDLLVAHVDEQRLGLLEVDDEELLDLPADICDVVVTRADLDGRTIADLAEEEFARSIFLRRITRAGTPVAMFPATEVQRGDVLTLVGPTRRVADAAKRIGVPDRATDVTDMVLVAFGIVAGALVGIPALMLGGLEIGLSLSVGVLLGGLVCGWLRSMWPRFFGRIPGPTLWVFESLGLAGFVAVVGLNAGPDFVVGLRTSGASLLARGAGHGPGTAPGWRRRRPLGVQDAPGRPARRVRRCRNRDAGARRDPGSGQEPRPDARLRRLVRGRQRAPRAVGHRHRRADVKHIVSARLMPIERTLCARAVVAIVLLLGVPATLWAQPRTDVVTLANGDRITGEVVRLDRGRLEFKTDDAGTLYFEWDKLASVVATRLVEVVTSDGRRFLGSLGSAATRSITVVTPGGHGIPPDAGRHHHPSRSAGASGSQLDGSIDAGFNYTQSSGVAQLNVNSDTIFRRPGGSGSPHRVADDDQERRRRR